MRGIAVTPGASGLGYDLRSAGQQATGRGGGNRCQSSTFFLGHGTGLSAEEADLVAKEVAAADVAAYGEALRGSIDTWTTALTDADVEHTTQLRRVNQRFPRYVSEAAWAEVESLDGIPAWQFLARPCVAHIRVHAGQIETLGAVLRHGAGAG